jgi:hypothetical protein
MPILTKRDLLAAAPVAQPLGSTALDTGRMVAPPRPIQSTALSPTATAGTIAMAPQASTALDQLAKARAPTPAMVATGRVASKKPSQRIRR